MLNKKNIAMAMAAVTVATPAASVFAATLDGETVSRNDEAKLAELKEEIKGYLDVKYSTNEEDLKVAANAGKCVYTITATSNETAPTVTNVETLRDLEKAIALLPEGKELSISVVDKGFKKVEDKVVDCEVKQYVKTEIAGLKATLAVANVSTVDEISANELSIKFQNNDEALVVKAGVNKLDPSKVIYKEDAYGNKLDKDGKITTKVADYVVLGFENLKENIAAADIAADKTFTVDTSKSSKFDAEMKTTELYDAATERLTVKGNELLKFLTENTAKITPAASDFALKFTYVAEDGRSYTINITGSKAQITEIKTVLAAQGVSTIAGVNRQETAIAVSKEAYKGSTKAQNIVLVSDYAIADGLAATPFAKQKNAPILLTNKDGISKSVMDEIERAMVSGGTVYLVGGESVLSENVEKQLDAKFIKTERISGDNREETSLEIARKMNATDKVFITGRYAEADAMSVANVAAAKGAPILLVSEKTGLSKDQARFVKDQANTTDAYIVGGESRVSSSVDEDVKGLVESTAKVTRIAGERRQETNAKVINEFYVKGTPASVSKVYVAKSDDKGLVDALPGGVLAAQSTSVVVLATDKLDASQEAVLNKLTKNSATKTQIGYGIASKVWEQIKEIF